VGFIVPLVWIVGLFMPCCRSGYCSAHRIYSVHVLCLSACTNSLHRWPATTCYTHLCRRPRWTKGTFIAWLLSLIALIAYIAIITVVVVLVSAVWVAWLPAVSALNKQNR
jgi:hypothetical protein